MGHSTLHVCINGQKIEGFDKFVDLESMSVDGGSELDIARWINSASLAVTALSKI